MLCLIVSKIAKEFTLSDGIQSVIQLYGLVKRQFGFDTHFVVQSLSPVVVLRSYWRDAAVVEFLTVPVLVK